ncbi:MAG: hypothetical protein ABIQ30_10640 [Devosia sp.]
MLALLAPLTALLGTEISTLKQRLERQALFWGLIGILGLVAVVFLLVAVNNALTFAVGPVVAPLIIAGAALLIGVVVFLIFQFRESVARHREAERQHNAEVTALLTTAAITAIPLILPTLRKVGLPAGGAAAAIFSLMRSNSLKRD